MAEDHFSVHKFENDNLKDFGKKLDEHPLSEPKTNETDTSFNISMLGNKRKNRNAFLFLLLYFTVTIVVFSVLINHRASNVFLIFGLVMSIVGLNITVLRFFLFKSLNFNASTLQFLRSIVFLIEIYVAISVMLFLFQSSSAAIMVAILFLCLAAFIIYECQRKYGADTMGRITFFNNEDEI